MPAAAVIGGIASFAGGAAIGGIAGGLMMAGGVASAIGGITGNKTLQTIGGVASLAGGGIALLGGGAAAAEGAGSIVGGGEASAASSALSEGSSVAGFGASDLGSGLSLSSAPSLAGMGGGTGLLAPAAGGAINDVVGGFASAGGLLGAGGGGNFAPVNMSGVDMGGGAGLQAPMAGGAINEAAGEFIPPPPSLAPSNGIQAGQYSQPGFTPGGYTPSPLEQPIAPPPSPSTSMSNPNVGSAAEPQSSFTKSPLESQVGTPQEAGGNGIRAPGQAPEQPGIHTSFGEAGRLPDATPGGLGPAPDFAGKGITMGPQGQVSAGGRTILDPTSDAARGFGAIKDKISQLGQFVKNNKDLFYIASQAFQMAYRGKQLPPEASAALEELRRSQANYYNELTTTSQQQRANAQAIPTINMRPTGASPFYPGGTQPVQRTGLIRAR